MAFKKKIVYIHEEFTGSVVTCRCGAIYKTSERVNMAEDEEDIVVRKRNYCSFCNACIGEFDDSIVLSDPRMISFFLIKLKPAIKKWFNTFFSVFGWYCKSSGMLMRHRIERIELWMKGLLRQIKS